MRRNLVQPRSSGVMGGDSHMTRGDFVVQYRGNMCRRRAQLAVSPIRDKQLFSDWAGICEGRGRTGRSVEPTTAPVYLDLLLNDDQNPPYSVVSWLLVIIRVRAGAART
jgi:hypothetical protein